MTKTEHYTTPRDGKISKQVGKQINQQIAKFEGKRIKITIERHFSKRSNQQNRLWWLYMTILSEELGYTKDEIHEICKFKFLKREKVIEQTGEVMEYLESTSALNKSDFGDLVDELIRWAAQSFDISLPVPNTELELNFNR